MNTQQLPNEEWRECQPGEIGQVANVFRRRKRNRTIAKVGSLTVAALLLLMVGGYTARTFLAPRGPSHTYYAGISCAEVHGLLPRLHQDRLPVAKSAQVRAHLDQCPSCRAAYQRMQNAAHDGRRGSATVALLDESP